jgi:iron complex outermembrane receptor protein
LTWDVDFTLAHNQLTIEKLSNDTYQTDDVPAGNLHGLSGLSGIYSQVLKEGQTIGTFVDGSGNILGDAQPDLNLSLNMYFSYRNFDASIATYGMLGQKVLNATAMVLSGSERFPSQNVLKNYFDLPEGVSSTEVSDYWVEDASFMRLQSVTVGYTIPALGDWFERARVYVTGENLFVLTDYSGIDPEINYTGLDHPGIDMLNYYPRPRAVTFGVNLTF